MNDLDIIGAEVYAIISKVSKEKQDKIPAKVFETFKKYELLSKKIKINPSIDFEKQNISKDAKDIIFVISLNYWLTAEERNEVIEKLKKNENYKNIEYDTNKIFKKFSNKTDEEVDKEIVKVERKEKWYLKIVNIIQNLFNKK